MTPRVLERELDAARLKATDRFKEGLADAWNVARMYAAVRSKKGLPPLGKVLGEVKSGEKSERQSVGQVKAALTVLSEQYGIKIRKGRSRG